MRAPQKTVDDINCLKIFLLPEISNGHCAKSIRPRALSFGGLKDLHDDRLQVKYAGDRSVGSARRAGRNFRVTVMTRVRVTNFKRSLYKKYGG